MKTYLLWLFLLFASVPFCGSLKIGFLLTARALTPGFPSVITSGGAVQLAVDEINRRYNTSVKLIWNNTECDVTKALLTGYEQGTKDQVDVIIGPACEKSMDLVTQLMAVLNTGPVPTITWLPRRQSTSYPNDTAISTYPSYETIADSLVVLLKYFSWKKVGIIASQDEICGSLIDTVNDLFPNKDLSIVRLLFLEDITQQSIAHSITEVKDHARVIILCMKPSFAREFLVQADAQGFTSKEFVFIYCRFGPSAESELIQSGTKGTIFAPLLQIGHMLPDSTIRVKNFTQLAKQSGFRQEPACCNDTDEFSMSLYDTFMFAADMYFNKTNNRTFNISAMARTFQTFSGTETTDSFGRIRRNVSVVYFQNGRFETVAMVTKTFNKVKEIQWPGGMLPRDSPDCGWQNEQCSEESEKDSNKNSVIIGSCVSLAVILVVAGALFACYKKSKFEKDLLNMIWKVNNNEIKLRRPRATTQNSIQDRASPSHPKKNLIRADTRGTLGLGSTSSIDKTMLYAPVGSYKGSIVAVKNIQRRSIQLTREMLRDLKALRELQHENLNPFIGVSLEPGDSYILMKYCSKGSLQDVLENDDIKLDNMFKMSFLMDLGRGLDFLHKSPVKSHGNLKSSNCVIDSRWVLKLTDYGAICRPAEPEPADGNDDNSYYSRLLWTAPELLRMHRPPAKGTQKGDVYSFAIIMHEILHRCPPYYFNHSPSNKTIIERLRVCEDPPYRPRITEDVAEQDKMVGVMTCCWHECPELRPDIHSLLKILIDINGKRKINIMDNMIMMLEAYSNNLEELVAERTEELAHEKQKTDKLLYQMLPPLAAEQLKRGEHVVPETFSEVSIFFSDIVGFTSISGLSTPLQVVDLLNDLYTMFDEIIGRHDVYKVETIGDAYMVSSGIPRRNGKRHSGEIANMALDLLSAVTSFRVRHKPEEKLQLRIGLHTGHCAAGVVGLTMPRYCLFGDTVNMASRMESTGKALHIHVSNDFADAVKDLNWGFLLLERGLIEVKGKGLQKTYWLVGKEGYTSPLPQEMQRLHEKYIDSVEKGRPLSPTDTHISNGSQPESTSMYGNAFRRASFAITFLRTLSQHSRESSPNASRVTVRDFDGENETASGAKNTLNIPNNEFKTASILPPLSVASDDLKASGGSSSGRKKKKRKKHRHKDKDNDTECVNNLNIPTIEITSQQT